MIERDDAAGLDGLLGSVFSAADRALEGESVDLASGEVGVVREVGNGVARIGGLPGLGYEELVVFKGGALGMALDLLPDEASIVLLSRAREVRAGQEARRTGRQVDVPVGPELLGRVLDPLGGGLDGLPNAEGSVRYPLERDALPIMARAPVSSPLQTGILAIDALIPVGRGQRELIIGDRQIGKTAIAIDTILNQRDKGVLCVYCSIGQQSSATAKVIAELRARGAMEYTVVIAAAGDDSPGLNYIAPYAAASIAEYFMERGRDTLVVFDDLSRHARSYRELSLLLRRPPAREAFPGDIFYIHSRLLERATHLVAERGGGSMTALPIVETEAQNLAAYIPTNLVSITDGQIYLTPRLFQEGQLPAIDVGTSVSRVGGKAQLPAYTAVAGDLRIAYSQFEELEVFERFSSRLDEATKQALRRGHRIREMLRQDQYDPIDVASQIALLLVVTEGILDEAGGEGFEAAKRGLRVAMGGELRGLARRIEAGEVLDAAGRERIAAVARGILGGASTGEGG
jgi:F-type H+-transporting ATPase subunit alpha